MSQPPVKWKNSPFKTLSIPQHIGYFMANGNWTVGVRLGPKYVYPEQHDPEKGLMIIKANDYLEIEGIFSGSSIERIRNVYVADKSYHEILKLLFNEFEDGNIYSIDFSVPSVQLNINITGNVDSFSIDIELKSENIQKTQKDQNVVTRMQCNYQEIESISSMLNTIIHHLNFPLNENDDLRIIKANKFEEFETYHSILNEACKSTEVQQQSMEIIERERERERKRERDRENEEKSNLLSNKTNAVGSRTIDAPPESQTTPPTHSTVKIVIRRIRRRLRGTLGWLVCIIIGVVTFWFILVQHSSTFNNGHYAGNQNEESLFGNSSTYNISHYAENQNEESLFGNSSTFNISYYAENQIEESLFGNSSTFNISHYAGNEASRQLTSKTAQSITNYLFQRTQMKGIPLKCKMQIAEVFARGDSGASRYNNIEQMEKTVYSECVPLIKQIVTEMKQKLDIKDRKMISHKRNLENKRYFIRISWNNGLFNFAVAVSDGKSTQIGKVSVTKQYIMRNCIQDRLLDDNGDLKSIIISEQDIRVCNIKKVVAITDIHGAYDSMLKILKQNEIIDGNNKWIATDTIFVFNGDILDRGPKSMDSLKLLQQLYVDVNENKKARNSVIAIVWGNHEIYYLAEIYREGYSQADYDGWHQYTVQTKNEFLSVDMTKYGFNQKLSPRCDTTKGLMDLNCAKWFFKNSNLLGNWLRRAGSISIIITNINMVFSHAGLTKEFLDLAKVKKWSDLDKLNEEWIVFLQKVGSTKEDIAKSPLMKLIWYPMISTKIPAGVGPYQNRAFKSYGGSKDGCDQLLELAGKEWKMFVGHNKDAINSADIACEGRLIRGDFDLWVKEYRAERLPKTTMFVKEIQHKQN